jgi:hypothetical protein
MDSLGLFSKDPLKLSVYSFHWSVDIISDDSFKLSRNWLKYLIVVITLSVNRR